MPWCPKCKNEYREGFILCTDCNIPLVDSLEKTVYTPLASFDNDEVEEKFIRYLDYSGIPHVKEFIIDTEYISFDPKNYEKAKKALGAFINVEKGLFLKKQIDSTYIVFSEDSLKELFLENREDDEESEEETAATEPDDSEFEEPKPDEELRAAILSAKSSSVYESKKYKADELYGSGIMFIIVGAMGMLFIILNLVGLINFLNTGFSLITSSIMFIGFIIGGIFSINSSKQYAKDSENEEKLTDYLHDWLKKNIHVSDLEEADDPDNSPEENYLIRTDFIKSKLYEGIPEYKNLDDTYLDSVIEDFYNECFGEER